MSFDLFRAVAVAALGTALGAASLSGTASAETFSANTFFGPQHPLAKTGYTEFAAAVAKNSGGEIEFEVFSGGSLLPPRESIQGTGDNVAQVTYHAGTYTPSDLPLTNVIADLSFLSPDSWVMAFASTDFNMNYPGLQAEWRKNNVVYGGGYSSIPYRLICAKPVRTLADLKGAKLRMPGGAWDRFATFIGATPVNVPGSEMYTGLQRGSLDCAANGTDSLETFGLWDVVKGVNMVGLGVYFSGVQWAYNADFWQERTPHQRRVLLDTMAEYMVRTTAAYVQSGADAEAKASSQNVELIDPDATVSKALSDFAHQDQATVAQLAKERHGVADPEPLIKAFNATIEKWKGLLSGVDKSDLDALIALSHSEIYDKIDENTYGME